MSNPIPSATVYTPQQVAEILQLSKNTVYELIGRGEIIAKKIGNVYRIPAISLSFMFTGLDYDLYEAHEEDRKTVPAVQQALSEIRKSL